MKIYLPLISILIGVCYAGVQDTVHQTGDTEAFAVARALFFLAGDQKDGILSFAELEGVFKDFDLNNDGNVTEHEFTHVWTTRGFGNVWDAVTIFNNLDVDEDGGITDYGDLIRIYIFFDVDGDDKVVQSEFAVQWVELSSPRGG